MFLPPQYFWLEPVIIAAVVVFVIDLVGNTIQQPLLERSGDVGGVRARLRIACLLRLRQYFDVGQFDSKCNRACKAVRAPTQWVQRSPAVVAGMVWSLRS